MGINPQPRKIYPLVRFTFWLLDNSRYNPMVEIRIKSCQQDYCLSGSIARNTFRSFRNICVVNTLEITNYYNRISSVITLESYALTRRDLEISFYVNPMYEEYYFVLYLCHIAFIDTQKPVQAFLDQGRCRYPPTTKPLSGLLWGFQTLQNKHGTSPVFPLHTCINTTV